MCPFPMTSEKWSWMIFSFSVIGLLGGLSTFEYSLRLLAALWRWSISLPMAAASARLRVFELHAGGIGLKQDAAACLRCTAAKIEIGVVGIELLVETIELLEAHVVEIHVGSFGPRAVEGVERQVVADEG